MAGTTGGFLAPCGAAAETAPSSGGSLSWPRLSSGPIEDNSFLIEEAYNQEDGVIQHIAGAQRDKATGDWVGSFTEEWPLPSQRHQASVTVPFSVAGSAGGSDGIGDILLNYRYQLYTQDVARPAVAPRASLLLPTGNHRRGLGSGSLGVQLNLPISKQLTDSLAGHFNAGVTFIPEARSALAPARSESLVAGTVGGSLIWEPAHGVNFLGEIVASRDEEIDHDRTRHLNRVTFSPGIRAGLNTPGGTQWVWGIGLPVGLTRETNDLGVLLYMSVEYAITRAARADRWP